MEIVRSSSLPFESVVKDTHLLIYILLSIFWYSTCKRIIGIKKEVSIVASLCGGLISVYLSTLLFSKHITKLGRKTLHVITKFKIKISTI